MFESIRSELIDPRALSSARRQALVDQLYATHAAIFAGVSRERFAAYVVDSPAERTRIAVFRAGERVVGYLAVHTFVREIDGERWVVLRAESGKLPAYRRAARAALMIAEILRACVRYPRARKAFLGCFVHPSAYLALAHVAPTIYPHWERPTPAPVQAAMDRVAAEFGLEAVGGAPAGVREVGWITRESEAERTSWVARRDPMARFFLRQNPGYGRGDGLVTLVPISLAGLVEGTLRHLERAWRRRLPGRGRVAGSTETRKIA